MKKIALVDDDINVRETLCEMLEATEKYKLSLFDSLDSLVKGLDNMSFDIIICDVHMPTGSGLRLPKILKDKKVQIPMVFISAMSDMIPNNDNLTILRKPISLQQLEIEIEKKLT